MRKSLLLLLSILYFSYSCHKLSAEYEGIWVNDDFDFISIDTDSIYIADAFAPNSYKAKYILKNDTIIMEGNSLFCKFQHECTLNFVINYEGYEMLIHPVPKSDNSVHFFSGDKPFSQEGYLTLLSWDSVVINRSLLVTYGKMIYSTIRFNNIGSISFDSKYKTEKNIRISYWDLLDKEMKKIHNDQFRVWNEGDIADGDYIELIIYRGKKEEKFYGSIIPFYYRSLRKLLNDLESKRLQDIE